MSANLPDKVAIVTGGAQGLGQAISQRLAREGCTVVIADVNEKGVGDTAAAIARETGRRVIGVKVDICVRRGLTQMPIKMDSAEGDSFISGVLFSIDPDSGRCVEVQRVSA